MNLKKNVLCIYKGILKWPLHDSDKTDRKYWKRCRFCFGWSKNWSYWNYKKHFASKNFFDRKYGFLLKNAKAFRIPITCKGKLRFFDVKLPKTKIKTKDLKADIIEEEYRYRLVGHH